MNKHLKESRMTYIEHFWFAMTFAMESAFMSVILFIHAIFPCIFTQYFTQWMNSCHARLQRRARTK